VTPPRIDDALADPVALTVGALAVYRATRLLVDDEVSAPVRDRIEAWAVGDSTTADEESRLAYFVRCPWCVSVWVGAAWVGLTVAAPRVARFAGAALAWSAVSGLLSSRE
jgi:hypothetical protein